MKKGSLEHVKTWFGRRFCCLVMYANGARFGKIFFVAANLYIQFAAYMHPKWLFRKFYKYFLDFLLNVGTRGLRISPQLVLEDVAAVLVIYANLPNLPCNPFPLLPNGPPSSPQIINTWRSF